MEEASKLSIQMFNEDLAKFRKGVMNIKNLSKKCATAGDTSSEAFLEPFLEKIEAVKADLETAAEQAKMEFKEMCTFLGEPVPPKTEPGSLFGTLSQFLKSFDRTLSNIESREERQKAAERRKREREAMLAKQKGKSKRGRRG